jgi:hypothetical protein
VAKLQVSQNLAKADGLNLAGFCRDTAIGKHVWVKLSLFSPGFSTNSKGDDIEGPCPKALNPSRPVACLHRLYFDFSDRRLYRCTRLSLGF